MSSDGAKISHLKIMATGSSTLAASRKFSDTLTGRKRLVHLPPVLWDELAAFDNASLLKRRIIMAVCLRRSCLQPKSPDSTGNGSIPFSRGISRSFLLSAILKNSPCFLNISCGKAAASWKQQKWRASWVSADRPWNPDQFKGDALKIFRSFYKRGNNHLICPVSVPGYMKRVSGMDIHVCNPEGLSIRQEKA